MMSVDSPLLSVQTVLKWLKKLYKPPKSFLHHRNPFELLIATVLSAQCTDALVNRITPAVFAKYRSPRDYVRVSQATLARDIHSVTFANSKAKHLRGLCRMLISHHNGRVPETMTDLLKLPGVGRKTAAIVLYVAFEKREGVPVDTHVLRLSRRLGLTKHSEQGKVELDLMRETPRRHWGELNPLMISHGRAVCTARNRKCGRCVFKKECPSSKVRGKRDLAGIEKR